jgi:hypothetical protein
MVDGLIDVKLGAEMTETKHVGGGGTNQARQPLVWSRYVRRIRRGRPWRGAWSNDHGYVVGEDDAVRR